MPYSAWLLLDGIHQPAKGNHTTYENFEKICAGLAKKLTGATTPQPRLAASFYCLIHVLLVTVGLLGAALCWVSPEFFTVYVVATLLGATWQGSARYNYHLLDAYEKKVSKQLGEAKAALM